MTGGVLIRKYLNAQFLLSSLATSTCLFILSIILCSSRRNHVCPEARHSLTRLADFRIPDATNMTDLSHPEHAGEDSTYSEFLQIIEPVDLLPMAVIPSQSITIILPIVHDTLQNTHNLLRPFLQPLQSVLEVIVICPDAIALDVRRMLQKTFASMGSSEHPDISLRPWQGHLDIHIAVLRFSMDSLSDWVLILDEAGLTQVSKQTKDVLLNPPLVTLPFGPKGAAFSTRSKEFTFGKARPAHHLYPPFVIPTSLMASVGNFLTSTANPWITLANRISQQTNVNFGGILVSARDAETVDLQSEILPTSSSKSFSQFVFLLPTRHELHVLAPLICKMKAGPIHPRPRVWILVYDDTLEKAASVLNWDTKYYETFRCNVKYDILTGRVPLTFTKSESPLLSQWLDNADHHIDVVFTLAERDHLVSFLDVHFEALLFGATHIRMPRLDLANTEWMSSLTLAEWKTWHRPRVDLSIITKDRPHSLTRLINSLTAARYFNDQVDLRINVEQDCDSESLRIAENITWPFGRVVIHRRVVHGGLLPAVVESWYPHNNHTYGLLLEDDIEVSPLYYAWLKMTLLRYRYGDPSNRAPHMFGISLYQQKHLELPMEGRQPFDPRLLFFKAGLTHPTTPYLSQVPCSWGAVYFPEHWREFHDYLSVRLSERLMPIDTEVVPDVRSNHWSKSWKKFYIELVYLRGYVMLYPNYDDFVSLSTNHLEVGSHVKVRSAEKQDLFLLPLMQLRQPLESSKLLDLPNHTLPSLEDMPILNLTGHITSMDALVEQGHKRRVSLLNCDSPSDLYNARSLMSLCVSAIL